MSRYETKFYLKAVIIGLFLLVLFGYGVYELWDYLTGPKITISSPENGVAVSESLIEVSGQTENTQEITLNDRAIIVNEKGAFNEKILLSYGYNILVLRAKDRFGKVTEERLQVVYK